jgi:ATP/maltotriose-dependent transcriptional regulator MalT
MVELERIAYTVFLAMLLAGVWGGLLTATGDDPSGYAVAFVSSVCSIAFSWWLAGRADVASYELYKQKQERDEWDKWRAGQIDELTRREHALKQARLSLELREVDLKEQQDDLERSRREAERIWSRLTLTLEEKRARLSGSERHILEMLEQGQSDSEIAAITGVSRQNINHKKGIFRAMGFDV